MESQTLTKNPQPSQLRESLDRLKKACDWQAIAARGAELPEDFGREWLEEADAVGFALGQLRRHDEALAMVGRAYALEPNHRRASALAYLHYDACWTIAKERRSSPEQLHRHKDGFRHWIAEALRLSPGDMKDLYRLGVFEAQLEACHDKVALRAFEQALDAWDQMSVTDRGWRHDLFKVRAKTLYAAARSAFRLNLMVRARKHCFECIRFDEKSQYLELVHKLGLAARICLQLGEIEAAERAVRIALDDRGQVQKSHLHALMARIQWKRGDVHSAIAWLDNHTRPERRDSPTWRLLGDLLMVDARLIDAERAYQAALQRDRVGRHLTLTRIGALREQKGAIRAAEQAYDQALDFRRRRYSSDHMPALMGKERCLRALGKGELADQLGPRLVKARAEYHPTDEELEASA